MKKDGTGESYMDALFCNARNNGLKVYTGSGLNHLFVWAAPFSWKNKK